MVIFHIAEIGKEIAGIEIESREIEIVLKLSKNDVQELVKLFEYLEKDTVFKWKEERGW